MKKLITTTLMVLAVAVAMAQAPDKFTYQAVVRNASNQLVSSQAVGVRISILQGGINGDLAYMETQTAVTNANALMTLQIGGGNVLHGIFADINWANGPYFLKSEIDPNGGTDYSVTSTQQLLSVPYALYAKDAGNGFSGDYNDLANTPAIPTVPSNVSAFTNDAGYLTDYTETDPQFNAWDKDYDDLTNKPTIPTVPTNVSSFTNDAGYITHSDIPAQVNADWNATSGAAQILNKPAIPTVPTNVSAFANDANYVTTSQMDAAGYITAAQVPTQVNADWNATTGAALILNKPTLFSGNYNDLTNRPTLFDGNYNSLSNRPNLAAVATSGNYNDLINKPSIPNVPTYVSSFTNDAGYVTSSQLNAANYITASQVPASQVNADWNATSGAAQILHKPTLFSGNYNDLTNKPTLFSGNYNDLSNRPNLATVATSGNYNDLTNKPAIPTVPTNVSAFTNDAGYLTSADVQQAAGIPTVVSAFQNDAGYITAAQVPAQVNADWNATSGAAKILNKPTIPTIPANVSAFYNDAGYITSASVPAIPTNVSAFTNDAGYITSANIPTVPANLSAFNNDMGYITTAQIPAQVNADWNATSGAAKILNKPNLFSGNYNDLTNKPTIPTVPSNVSVFNNDAHYITEAQLNALLASVNNTIDSLRNRIGELENGTTPVTPDPVTPDTTIPIIPGIVDGQGCPGKETIFDYDGNPYSTVVIGQQCWMKTNLRTTHYSNGTTIGLQSGVSSSVTYPARYYPGSNSSNLNTYGYLYNWYAVMNGNESSNTNPSMVQGICPVGWHVPSNSEWSQLTNYVNSYAGFQCSSTNQYIAKALCSPEYWSSSTTNLCAVGYTPSVNNNATGFSALPAGALQYANNISPGSNAYFWSCTQSNSGTAYNIYLGYNSPTVGVNADGSMSSMFSVRCVWDSAVSEGGAQAVVTGFVNNITSTTAQCGGSVVTDNGYVVTERGVCWSTSNPPMVYHNRTIDGAGMGSFVSNLTGLTPGTTYYVRAYAMTSSGTIYGGVVSFTTPSLCGTSTVSDYDQNEYHTVQIGNQCWMKENLRTTHYADGTAISTHYTYSTNDAYYYTPNGGSIEKGYFYNWKAVMRNSSSSSANPSGVQGICPTGWHVPSDAEWAVLEDFVGGQDTCKCSNNTTYIGKALAATSGWTVSTNTCAVGNGQTTNNKTGFSALPVGYKYGSNSNYSGGSGNDAYFWSSTQSDSSNAWYRSLDYSYAGVTRTNQSMYYGYSVRCLRD